MDEYGELFGLANAAPSVRVEVTEGDGGELVPVHAELQGRPPGGCGRDWGRGGEELGRRSVCGRGSRG